MSEDNTTTNPSGNENSQGNPADVPKKKSLARKALTGFVSAYREVSEEAQAETHRSDESSKAHSALFLCLSLWLFKIPVLSDALIAAAPTIKSLVDKIPLKVFLRRIRETIAGDPSRYSGTMAIFMAGTNFVGFLGLRIGFPLIMLLSSLSGIGSALFGDDAGVKSAEADMKSDTVFFWVFYGIYLVFALFTLYVSVAIIRIGKFDKANMNDVKSVVLSTFAVMIIILLFVMMTTTATDIAKMLAEKP